MSIGKRVILTLLKENFEQGFPAILRIREDGAPPETEIQVEGYLPKDQNISQSYDYWQLAYCQLPGMKRSLKQKSSPSEHSCSQLADELAKSLNTWLNSRNSDEWQNIRDGLQQNLKRSDEIRVIIQTKDPQLRRLPWHLWNLFAKDYPYAEIALSAPEFKPPLGRKLPAGNQIRILAILGDKQGAENHAEINNQLDLNLLKQHLGDRAEIVPLIEPSPENLRRYLWSEKGWHILFFAGHSDSEITNETGWIKINQNDILTIPEFKNALSVAIENGLQLAIFNSCNGLGLANQLEELHIPQVIVMRERVSDQVAPEFLDHFLTAFSNNKSLYNSVGSARKKLEGWERKYPGTSWLPIICQNPALEPLTWKGLLPKKDAWILQYTITGHSDIIKSVAIHPNGQIIASSSLDKTIKLWNLSTGQLLHTLTGHSSAVISVTFSPDGKTLASASNMEFQDGTIKLWDVETGTLKQTLGCSLLALRTSCLAFSPDGQTLATGHIGTTPIWAIINLWNLSTGQTKKTLRGHGWEVNSIAFSKDGRLLISGGLDGAIKIWNWYKEELLHTLNRPSPSHFMASLVSWFDSSVGMIWSVAISPDGKTLASSGSDQPIKLWNAQTGNLLGTFTEHSDSVYSLAFSPDGQTLASGGADNTLRIWNMNTRKQLDILEHLGPVQSVVFSSDGQTLVSGSHDRTIKIWRYSL